MNLIGGSSPNGTLAIICELMELHYDPPFASEFVPRLNDLAPGAIEKFDGNYYHTFESVREAFETLTDEDFERLADKYAIDYLVLPSHTSSDLPVIYRNPSYTFNLNDKHGLKLFMKLFMSAFSPNRGA